MDGLVPDNQADTPRRGPLRALLDWLGGAVERSAPPHAVAAAEAAAAARLPDRIGHYAITRKVGTGGMGVVYAARDERLGRTVALKTLLARNGDDVGRQRLWREARAAASVNHPNVCQIYEIVEDGGELFIAMEFLDGESLADRLQRGPLNVADALPIALEMLAALGALHARGIVHRDLKPSNVFLTAHGVKLLDFGLARPELDQSQGEGDLTRTGVVIGTPRYMSPEQVTGEPVDPCSDLFSAGAILFEMLAGRPAFGGRNVAEIFHATLYEQPPALSGSPAVVAVDRVIRRALAKKPAERPRSAEAMAGQLRDVRGTDGAGIPVQALPLTRLVVLPFRVLRPDPETDFLAYSLPDAIATSLSGNGSLIVRSSATASRFAGEAVDLKALAAEADVDRVVMGTLLRSGDQVRAATQLVEAPAGTLVTSHTVQASLGDLFRLQDDIAGRVADALSLPLAGGTASLTPDVPHNARAYELYLRGNELGRTYDGLPQARDLYLQCLDLDPNYAPAWARLGRCYRVIDKYLDPTGQGEAMAADAFRRALAINPRLSIAHKFYANLEADTGQAQNALVRLLNQATRHGNDPELFAGLVHACRYCGLYEQSIAAHMEARRLDPNIATSVEQTVLMTGDIDRLLAIAPASIVAGADDVIRVIGLGLYGRREQARERLGLLRAPSRIPAFLVWMDYLIAWIERRPDDMLRMAESLSALKIQDDPEAMFQEGWLLCDAGAHEAGLADLRRAVAKGYCVAPTLANSPHFDPLRENPVFQQVLADAESGRQQALAAFRAAGGERLLGA